MKIFNREVIEKFTERCPDEVADRVIAISTGLLSKCIDELKLVTPALAGDYNFIIVDDHYFDCSTVNSNLNLFVVFNSPQLEINTYKLVNDKFKQFTIRLKHAWQSNKRKKRKSKKNKNKNDQEEIIINNDNNKYTIANLKNNLITKVVQNIDKESYVQETKFGFKLVSNHELGIAVNIYPVISTNGTYNLYNAFTNKFFNVDFKNREINFKNKLNEIGENFIYMIRVFNNLYFSIYNHYPNQILIESIMYNIPNSLFLGNDFYENFIKILNYLNNTNLKSFKSIIDNTKHVYEEILITENVTTIINEIIKYVDSNM